MTTKTRNALLFAGLLLLVAFLGREAQDLGLLAPEPERVFGVVMGSILIGLGNALPKRSAPSCHGGAGEAFRVRRFVGWAFILAGAAHAVIWIAAPSEHAAVMAMLPVAAATVIAILAFMRGKRTA
ncbi:MAG: hypothetical protein V2I43_01435 [Parvularcula sp.]|jgi:hypothetical protein|nr:hypothetical protein [Parvularcula sp.]